MQVVRSDRIDGVVVVVPDVHRDDRGTLVEVWRRDWFPEAPEIVQANRADRRAGTLVGLHFHRHQTDVWHVVSGLARVVLHDLRAGSPTAGATVTLDLGARADERPDHRVLHIPPGVAHGFAALTDVVVSYLVDRVYDPDDELGVAWDDPAVAADWAVADPIVSPRDQANPRVADLADELRPRWAGAPAPDPGGG